MVIGLLPATVPGLRKSICDWLRGSEPVILRFGRGKAAQIIPVEADEAHIR